VSAALATNVTRAGFESFAFSDRYVVDVVCDVSLSGRARRPLALRRGAAADDVRAVLDCPPLDADLGKLVTRAHAADDERRARPHAGEAHLHAVDSVKPHPAAG
jgi:hypothetical protein